MGQSQDGKMKRIRDHKVGTKMIQDKGALNYMMQREKGKETNID